MTNTLVQDAEMQDAEMRPVTPVNEAPIRSAPTTPHRGNPKRTKVNTMSAGGPTTFTLPLYDDEHEDDEQKLLDARAEFIPGPKLGVPVGPPLPKSVLQTFSARSPHFAKVGLQQPSPAARALSPPIAFLTDREVKNLRKKVKPPPSPSPAPTPISAPPTLSAPSALTPPSTPLTVLQQTAAIDAKNRLLEQEIRTYREFIKSKGLTAPSYPPSPTQPAPSVSVTKTVTAGPTTETKTVTTTVRTTLVTTVDHTPAQKPETNFESDDDDEEDLHLPETQVSSDYSNYVDPFEAAATRKENRDFAGKKVRPSKRPPPAAAPLNIWGPTPEKRYYTVWAGKVPGLYRTYREARSQTTKNNVFEGRSYYTQAESESAFKHAEAVGALQGAFLSWDVGFWVVLRGQVPGIYEGRADAAAGLGWGRNAWESQIECAGNRDEAEKVWSTVRSAYWDKESSGWT